MKVEVSDVHIKKGLVKSYTHDPICLAIKEALKKQFSTDITNVLICNQDYVFINGFLLDLPEQVRTFIKLWDTKKYVKPISFELELPDDLLSKPIRRQ